MLASIDRRSLVMIDLKHNRNNDTGRFELIYKGAPVPVPIYVGIDLRVEGNSRNDASPVTHLIGMDLGKPYKNARRLNDRTNRLVTPVPMSLSPNPLLTSERHPTDGKSDEPTLSLTVKKKKSKHGHVNHSHSTSKSKSSLSRMSMAYSPTRSFTRSQTNELISSALGE